MIVLACLGGTLGWLDAPDRAWPWFTVGFAGLYALVLIAIAWEERAAAAVQAMTAAVIIGGAFAYAGFALAALGYGALGWFSWAVAVALGLNAVVRLILAAMGKK